MSNGEQKADQILATLAEVAVAAGAVPTPASTALELFGAIEPIVGPEIVGFFGSLFSKIKNAVDPKQASLEALKAGHEAINSYVAKMPQTQTSGQILGGD